MMTGGKQIGGPRLGGRNHDGHGISVPSETYGQRPTRLKSTLHEPGEVTKKVNESRDTPAVENLNFSAGKSFIGIRQSD